jgi:hypothetical protein
MEIIENKNKNKKYEDLTLEEAKEFEYCKNLTDEEIKELLEAVKIFTEIVYIAFAKEKLKAKQHEQDEGYKMAA